MTASAVEHVAVIPARGGSKRIPQKNIKPFLGVPLIQRTIATLLNSRSFERVIVSTDDEEIAQVSRDAGAETPFRRPSDLADDSTPTAPVILHALRWLAQAGAKVGEVAVVYPAAVLMVPEDLMEARSLLKTTGADMVFSACAFEAPIQRAWRRSSHGLAEMILPEYQSARTQDLETAYFDAGQFYCWAAGTASKLERSLPVTRAMYVMPPWRVRDIDTQEDWEMAERLYKLGQD